jgi:2'-5' RNA ligase
LVWEPKTSSFEDLPQMGQSMKKQYCTMFAFDDHHDDLHCTHKFLGTLTPNEVKAIEVILKHYFTKNPFKSFKVKFDEEKFFGENEDIRVVATSTSTDKFLPDLRKTLDLFRDDDFDYNPHITTDQELINKPLTRYLFACGDDIIAEYKSQ